MKTFTAIFAALLLPMLGFAQELPIIRNPVTTNRFMNKPQDGWIAIWNDAAKRWSNGVNTATATNSIADLNGKGTNTGFYGSLTSVGAATFQNTVEVQGLGTGRRALFIDQNNIVQARSDVDDTELSFLDGVTSGIQAQIDAIGGGSVDPTNAVLANFIGTGAKTNQEVIYIASAGSSPAGSDANPGSSAAPILNIDTAAFRLRGNGTVIMKDGTHAQNPNWGLWTNLVLKSQTPGMTENILGTNISAFTTIGSGVYRITYIPSSWLMYSNDGTGFIWQLGSNSFDTAISPSERHPLTPNQDYYLHGMVHLTNIATVAGLQNGSYAISNNDIYFKFADGGVPNSRTIQLPALQTTNSFGYGGQLYSSIEIIGIRSYFGNCGTVVTGTKKFVTHNCWFVGSYAEGRIDDSMQGVDESYTDAYLFNSNDGVGLTSAGTNVYPAKFINPLVVGNQDGGIDTHTFAACTISGGVLARQIRGAGSTAFGGGQNEATGTRFILNLVGAFPAGGGVFYDASRTNFYSTFICDNCTFISNTFGCFIENAATNLLLRLKGTTTFIGNGNDIVNYIDGVNQRLEEEGVIVSDKPLIYLHLGSNSNPPTKSTALYVVSSSPSGVTLGNTNLTVQTLQVTGINTNGILYTGASGQVSTAALSGLTFSGGVLTATSGGGTPAGNSGAVQFNEGGVFAGTNDVIWDRTNNVLRIGSVSGSSSIEVGNFGSTLSISGPYIFTKGAQAFRFGVNNKTNWGVEAANGDLIPQATNNNDIGSFLFPVRTNYANDFVAKETVSTPQITLTGSGVGSSSYYDVAGTEYSQFVAPANINSNNVLILPTNATAGIMVAQPFDVGTNKWQNVALTPGQYVTYNGTAYVPSNLPAGGGGGITSSQATNITRANALGTETWIDVVRDYGADNTGATDSTMAISNALWNAVQLTNHATTTTIYFPARGPTNQPGIYKVSGGTNWSSEMAQLIIPMKQIFGSDNSNQSVITLRGPSGFLNGDGTSSGGSHGFIGSTILSTLTNLGGSVIASAGHNAAGAPANPITLRVIDLNFRTPSLFAGTVINITNIFGCEFNNVMVTHSNSVNSIPFKPLQFSTAIDAPRKALSDNMIWDRINICGYDEGLRLGEHNVVYWLHVSACSNAVTFKSSDTGNKIYAYHSQANNHAINVIGASIFDIDYLFSERAGTGTGTWQTNEYEIFDPSNLATGCIDIRANDLVNAANSSKITQNGGQHLRVTQKQRSTWVVYSTDQGPGFLRGPHLVFVDSAARSGQFTVSKTRGTMGAPATVTSTDTLGGYSWGGHDGTAVTNSGNAIYTQMRGTIAANTLPGSMDFYTGTNATTTSLKMRIEPAGHVGVGNDVPLARLSVSNHLPASVGFSVDQISTAGADIARFREGNVNAFVVATNGVIATNNWAVFAPVTTNIFVLGTRYTNSSSRAFLAASVQLNAAAAGTSKVSLYVEHGTTITNSVSVSAGPLASLVTVEQLSLLVPPGGFYYFTDETSGAGASASIVGDKCSITAF